MKRQQDRLSHLDGLRGVAILCVVGFHTYFLIPSLAGKFLPGGFLGVDLFFVLCGFLMTSILLEEGANRRFYARRAVRILPALYLFLFCQVLYTYLLGDPFRNDLRAVIPMALGIGNWNQTVGIPVPLSLAQTWSLGIEEQFYILWPIVMVLCVRGGFNLKKLCVVGILVSLTTKLLLAHMGVPLGEIFSQTEARFDDFLVGAVVALMWREGWRPSSLPKLTAVAASIFVWALAFAAPNARWLYDGGFTAIAVVCGVLVLACVNAERGLTILTSRALRAMGRFSYSAYLWHPFIFFAVYRALPHNTVARVGLAGASLVAVAVFSTVCIEEPLRRLVATRWTASRLRAAAVASEEAGGSTTPAIEPPGGLGPGQPDTVETVTAT